MTAATAPDVSSARARRRRIVTGLTAVLAAAVALTVGGGPAGASGVPVPSAGAIITGSPTVYNGVAYVGVSSYEEVLAKQTGYQCCTFRGKVVALNATTGQILWTAYTVPSNNNGSDSNLPGYYSGGAVWGSAPAVDPA